MNALRSDLSVTWVGPWLFKSLDPPYFNLEYLPEKDEFRGEDYYFFDHARAAGWDLYIDHDLSKEVYHMGSFAYNPQIRAFLAAAGKLSDEEQAAVKRVQESSHEAVSPNV